MMTKYCIGVDIGGTKTSIAVVETNKGKVIINKIIKSKATTNDQQNLNNIILETTNLINEFKSKTNIKIKKIGIGVPELINNKGIIRDQYNFKWHNFDLSKKFNKKGLSIKVDSDVRNAIRAEKYYGYGHKIDNFIYINIGTGLSFSHFKNNKIYSGANGFAISFASSKITLFNPQTNKKLSLIPEDYYSGKSIIKFLKKYNKSPKKKKYINNIAESLGSLIGNLINSVDPSMVVLGGGVIVKNENFRDRLIQYTRNFIFAKDLQSMKIKISKLGDDTGLIGSAALFK